MDRALVSDHLVTSVQCLNSATALALYYCLLFFLEKTLLECAMLLLQKQEKTWRCFCLSVAAHLRECQEIRMSLVTHSPTAIKCIIFGSLKTETNPRPAGVAMLGYWDACNIL